MTLDELKVLLKLNGNQRIAHLESEIFVDLSLTILYLESLCSKYDWSYIPSKRSDLLWLIYRYARFVIKGRWPEAEGVIRLMDVASILMANVWVKEYNEYFNVSDKEK